MVEGLCREWHRLVALLAAPVSRSGVYARALGSLVEAAARHFRYECDDGADRSGSRSAHEWRECERDHEYFGAGDPESGVPAFPPLGDARRRLLWERAGWAEQPDDFPPGAGPHEVIPDLPARLARRAIDERHQHDDRERAAAPEPH